MSATASQKTAGAYMQTRRRRLKAMGQWNPFMEAEPVRQHLREVTATGMSYAAISAHLGLPSESSLQHLVWGRGKYGPGSKVARETGEMILSFWPTLKDFPDAALIDGTGTRRRVQALGVRGWSRNWIGEKTGMWQHTFRRAIQQDRVTARLARRVAAIYDEYWNQDPLEHGISLNAVARVRAQASRAGWDGPLAWDDDTIDDPKAVPQTDAVAPIVTEGPDVAARWLMGESVVLGTESRKEVLAHLFEWTQQTPEEIAEQIGMTPGSASMAWERIKRQARKEGRPAPWRRAYWLRDKELTTNEMEQTA